MTHIEGHTQFRRSPADMFDFLADPRHEPRYNPLIVDAEKLTPGSIGPGTRFRQRTQRFGRRGEITIGLVGAERPRRLTWRIESAGRRLERRVWSDMQHHLDRPETSTASAQNG